MIEKIIDPSTSPVYTKEEQYRFVEYLRNLAYGVASHYGKDEKLRRAAVRGLVDAIRLFKKKEYAKKFKFSIYAIWFMKESVEKELEKENKA